MKSIIVNLKKETLLSKYILSVYKSLPYSYLYKAIRKKDIKVNGLRVNKDILVKDSDVLYIYISDDILFNIPKDIEYVYEDDNILVVNKPNNILSNNEEDVKNNIKEYTLEDIVKKYNDKVKICHRLDRNTCGLVVFAKNDIAYTEILNAFKNKKIKKEYIAYVHNYKFDKKHDILKSYLVKDSKNSFVKIYDTKTNNSSEILTEYTVLDVNAKLDYAKLNVIIHTGKTHQIRAHLSHINHPIIGDSKYGLNEVNNKFKKYSQALSAYKYTFNFDKDSILYYLNDIKIEKEYTINFDD